MVDFKYLIHSEQHIQWIFKYLVDRELYTREIYALLLLSCFSHIWRCATLWAVACRLLCPWDSPGKSTGEGCHALLQGIFPTQGWNPGLPRCRRILYCLSHQESPRILEWVAYSFFRSSWSGIKLGSPAMQVDSLPAVLPKKPRRTLDTMPKNLDDRLNLLEATGAF